MKGFAYFDSVNRKMVKVNVRYPDDLEYCTGRPSTFDLIKYLNKHPDEHDFLIGEHNMKNRLFREDALNALQRDVANSKSFMSKLKKDESFKAFIGESNDTA